MEKLFRLSYPLWNKMFNSYRDWYSDYQQERKRKIEEKRIKKQEERDKKKMEPFHFK